MEPTPEERASGVSYRWGSYKNGKHKPLGRILDLAEEQVPGSKAIFQSPLWDALHLGKSAATVAVELQGRTSREGDELLYRMLGQSLPIHDPRWLRKRCRAMVADGSLEALAVLTVCMRLAGHAKASSLALTFYRHATDTLMILGGWFYLHGIAPAIAEHYEKVLLPKCCVEHQLGTFSSSYYLYSVRALIRAALCEQEKEGRELTQDEVISVMCRHLYRS